MEILVLVMLSLFLLIIAIAVIIYVNVRKNLVNKKFDKFNISKVDDDFDDDDDEYEPLNIVMPSSFKRDDQENLPNEIMNDTDEKEVQVINPVIVREIKQERIEEVVNVLISKRNYIFLANNNVVSKNDRVKLMLDGKVYFGIITKANYQRDISLLKAKPRKLIIIKNKEKNDVNSEERNINNTINNTINLNDLEFIPVKKDKY